MAHNILHVFTVSFSINYFVGGQFSYLKTKTGNSYFVACSPSQELQDLALKYEFKAFSVPISRSITPLQDIRSVFSLCRVIRKNKIDKVVGHTPKGALLAMMAAFLCAVSDRIYFRHGIFYETTRGLKRYLLKNMDRLAGLLATKVVCVSHDVKRISEEHKISAPSKNIILGKGTCNGVDVLRYFNPKNVDPKKIADLRQRYSIKEDDFVVGFVGRMTNDKGVPELVRAWALLNEKTKGNKLLLLGPLNDRDAVSEEVKHNLLNSDSIIYAGEIVDVAPYYALMDVFVLPTYREGFPTVVLEASSMELPVLVTRATGCKESIIEGKTGCFISHDINDIVTKIIYYKDNPVLRGEQGKEGRKFIQQYFQQEKVWDLIHLELGY